MPIEDFKLPTGEEVRLIYGQKHPGKGTVYLNAVRMGINDKDNALAKEYHAMRQTYTQCLAREVNCSITQLHAVVSPPSSREDATPFRKAIIKDTQALDLTPCFSRHGKLKMANSETTMRQAIDEFRYEAQGCEGSIKSLLIVDESIASGKTIAAVLYHMRQAGLPPCTTLNVAVWAKFKKLPAIAPES